MRAPRWGPGGRARGRVRTLRVDLHELRERVEQPAADRRGAKRSDVEARVGGRRCLSDRVNGCARLGDEADPGAELRRAEHLGHELLRLVGGGAVADRNDANAVGACGSDGAGSAPRGRAAVGGRREHGPEARGRASRSSGPDSGPDSGLRAFEAAAAHGSTRAAGPWPRRRGAAEGAGRPSRSRAPCPRRRARRACIRRGTPGRPPARPRPSAASASGPPPGCGRSWRRRRPRPRRSAACAPRATSPAGRGGRTRPPPPPPARRRGGSPPPASAVSPPPARARRRRDRA